MANEKVVQNPFSKILWGDDNDNAIKCGTSLTSEVGSSHTTTLPPQNGKWCRYNSKYDVESVASSRILEEHKQSLKKSIAPKSSNDSRKLILRESKLKALHCYVPTQNSAWGKWLRSSNSTTESSRNYAETFRSLSYTPKKDSTATAVGFSDFRDLINELQELSKQHNVDFITHRSESHQSKSLTTLRELASTTHGSAGIPFSTNSILISMRNNSSSSPEHNIVSVTTPNSSSTCSQQAGNNEVANNADVTIYDLAGYFETILHIPKQMSSMAEMMYS